MIKTLFASLCVVACCVGNDYPVKADCTAFGGTSAFYQCQANEFNQQTEMNNMRNEMEYQRRLDMDDLRREMQQRSY